MKNCYVLASIAKFHQNCKSNIPLLIGYSGGGDSKALLYALLEVGCKNIIVVHVNHHWRVESDNEAADIHSELSSLGVQFYIENIAKPPSNKEALAREARLQCFKKIYLKHKCDALLLAHHRDDRIETTFQRIFEGAHLPYVGGIQQESVVYGMTLKRPFLGISKQHIQQYLQEKKLSFVDDYTNYDSAMLRGNLRTNIFPFLDSYLGKSFRSNLLHVADMAEEWRSDLDQEFEKIDIQRSILGSWIRLPSAMLPSTLRYAILKLCKIHDVMVSRDQVSLLLNAIQHNKSIYIDDKIAVSGDDLFFLNRIDKNKFCIADISASTGSKKLAVTNWRSLFSNPAMAVANLDVLCADNLYLSIPKPGSVYRDMKLGKWYNQAKVPACLRFRVPVVYQQDKIVADFLSGYLYPTIFKNNCFVKIEV